jgi:adenosylcobinamide amidohydrolase
VSIDGVVTRVSPEAVVVTAERELYVLSSAVVNGGFARARAVLNVHVPKDFPCADPEPAALVNLVATLTEVKTDVLRAAGVCCDDGRPATGTSSDAVVVAATGRGARCRFGGPVTDVGWAAAAAARRALEAGVRRWLAEHA